MLRIWNGGAARGVAAAAVTVLALGLAACGGDDDDDGGGATESDESSTETTESDESSTETTAGGAAGGGADAVAYEVTGTEYTDASAPAGGTLEITNSSGGSHTFTADDGAFDVAYGPDESATVDVPDQPGEYPFHCEIHPSMAATLTVE